MAIKIGITGGIGAGKTVVSKLFTVMQIPVYDCDSHAKQLMQDERTKRELIKIFGNDILLSNGTIDKKILARLAFSNEQLLAQLNNLVHPQVKANYHNWCNCFAKFPFVALESAILFESDFEKEVNAVVMVYAPLELRIERTKSRDRVSKEQILQRMQNQMCDEEKCKRADFVVINDENKPLIPQLVHILNVLQKR